MGVAGIYQITNRTNGESYVGSSKDLYRCKLQHFRALELGIHENRNLQRAVHEHGIAALDFRVIGTCAKEDLIRLEQECMDHLKPEYNIGTMADKPMFGRKHTTESRARIGASIKQHVRRPEALIAAREKAKAAWRRSGITGLGGL